MTMDQLMMLGVIPAALVVAAGWLMLQRGPGSAASRRLPLFVMGVGTALLLAVFVAGALTPAQDNRPVFIVTALLAPVIVGGLALVITYVKDLRRLRRGEKALALLLGLVSIALLAGLWAQPAGWASVLLPGAALLALVWALGMASRSLAAALSLVALVLLALLNLNLLPRLPEWLGPLWLLVPVLPVATAAVLVSTSLQPLSQASAPGRASWWSIVWRLGLAAALLGYLAYSITWASIWDQTSDGLGGISLAMPAGLAAVASGMLMGMSPVGWRRLAGLAFAIVTPLTVFGAFNWVAWGGYHAITEARAARLQDALERFHTRSGRYPQALSELIPNDLWWIPEPVILRGQGWCYQGGSDFYRLGAIYREYFSTPLSVRVYASAGNPSDANWECDEKLAELKPRYDPPPMAGVPDTVPALAPLPTSVVPVERTPIEPIVRAASISLGSWSPDGHYLAFGLLEVSGDQSVIGLNFLNAATGEVCPASETRWATEWASDGLREHFAWLPDGRLLFVSAAGETMLFRPCAADVEDLTGRYPVAFTHAAAYDGRSGRVLLKNQASYWILDVTNLEARPIAGISPNPYESHWDRYAWSPGGGRLAIARLNGRGRQDGATLYIVEGATGTIEKSLPLQPASDQSAPMVEWLTNDELMLHGEETLAVIDVSAEPPKITDVLKDVFLLDVAYPDDFASMASVAGKAGGGYHIAVRVNHPRNQAAYVYHSETRQVEVLQSEVDLLLFFPDGQWTELPRAEFPPTYRDEYELVWVDTPQVEPRRLVVEGHVPRNYPGLFARYLPTSSRMAFSSSQGVSLISMLDGTLLGFWELEGGSGSPSTYLLPSPDGQALVAVVERVGLYYIPLPPR